MHEKRQLNKIPNHTPFTCVKHTKKLIANPQTDIYSINFVLCSFHLPIHPNYNIAAIYNKLQKPIKLLVVCKSTPALTSNYYILF